jgi:hypothetical protein
VTEPRLSPPDDEKLRRCAWVKDTPSILPLFQAARDHLAFIQIPWEHVEPYPTTTDEPGTFAGGDLRRWIHSVQPSDTDAVEKLTRFTVSCAHRFGQMVGHMHSQVSLSAAPEERNMSQPDPPQWLVEFAWKVHLLVDDWSLVRFRDMLKEWKRGRD